jgi:hypothetical protein
MLRYLLLPFLISFIIIANGQENHSNWNKILSIYVDSEGKVDYEEWNKSQEEINNYINMLSKHDLKFNSEQSEKAYWINLYNASTIQIVLKNYPINSIREINNGKVWDEKFISVQGVFYSLNQIENEILRKKFNDARIHFGINCAAISCPKLNNKAFTSSNVNVELEKLTSNFINTNSKITSNSIVVSKIFDWYKEDFKQNGGLIDYLNNYLIKKVPKNIHVDYSNYNWNLNKK